MAYIGTGVLGFLLIHLFDIASLKRLSFGIKPWLWITGNGLLIYSVVMLCLRTNTLPVPAWLSALAWGLLPLSALLLVYTLFINIPFRKTYVSVGAGGKLVKTGFYALMRHPGVLWMALLMLSLTLVSKSRLMLLAAPLFSFINLMLVVLEDKFLFVRMFEGYDIYQQETPMLVPNRRSINAFIKSLKQSGV